MPKIQFRIWMLLLVLTIVGLICAVPVYRKAMFHADRIKVGKLLRNVQGIEKIWIDPIITKDSTREKIFTTSFSLKDRPHTLISIKNLENSEPDGRLKEIELTRIGDLQIWVQGKHGPDSKLSGDWYSSGVEVGCDEVSQRLIPIKIETFQELVDRYDEILAIVDKWPRLPGEYKFVDRKNRELSYYVAQRDDATALERNREFANKKNDR